MKLIIYPNDILKRVMPDFNFLNGVDPLQIEQDMISIMQENHGIGLSANQVGLEGRVIVIQPQNLEDCTPFALFNPVLLDQSTEINQSEEGCLSFPDLYLEVKRSKNIKVQYVDKYQNTCIIEFTDIDARCFLHELDHLNGICFTDKVSHLKLSLALKKQRKKNGRAKRKS